MSNAVFPTLPGIAWNVARVPEFHTKTQKAISGREIRLAFMAYPMYTFKMSFEVLRDGSIYNELKTLGAFFLARQGSFDSFLYTDPSDNTATSVTIGIGDSTTTAFQLSRPYGPPGATFTEPVQNVNGSPNIFVNGTLQTSGYTIDSNGVVTFTTAPGYGQSIQWTGSFYYRVRFAADTSEFNQFMQDLWELKKCDLYGSLANKV